MVVVVELVVDVVVVDVVVVGIQPPLSKHVSSIVQGLHGATLAHQQCINDVHSLPLYPKSILGP